VGNGWRVDEFVCTRGPHDRPFEERHSNYCIAIVVAGTFQYRTSAKSDLMTPGSLFLGNNGESFECSHEHGSGDRCLSFSYTPEYFEGIAADAGVRGRAPIFAARRVPPLRDLSPIIARAMSTLASSPCASWEEIGLHLALRTIQLTRSIPHDAGSAPAGAVARVTQILRRIEQEPDAELTLAGMACDARLSHWHFLRTFESLTGITPHQYLLRTRLRLAAARLAADPGRVIDIAFECGFDDVSSFNRAFRSEFGMSPRTWRARR
jgi:AraC family transcriptional regulator